MEKTRLEESPYEKSFVSAMIPKLEYDALIKARNAAVSTVLAMLDGTKEGKDKKRNLMEVWIAYINYQSTKPVRYTIQTAGVYKWFWNGILPSKGILKRALFMRGGKVRAVSGLKTSMLLWSLWFVWRYAFVFKYIDILIYIYTYICIY